MKIAQLEAADLKQRLEFGICIKIGPFIFHISCQIESLAPLIHSFYGDFPLLDSDQVTDFRITLAPPKGLRRYWRKQVLFKLDHQAPFQPFAVDLALPLLEWGMNWCIATRAHQFLMLHAAVVEKQGGALILPAYPGSGKSTLCAALSLRGWRLLSDEFGLVRSNDFKIAALPKPIALKNQSIDVIRQFSTEAILGPVFPKTRKGSVCHLRVPSASIDSMAEPALPKLLVFPFFQAGAQLKLEAIPKTRSILKLANNAFNYEILGDVGFQMVRHVVRLCSCYKLTYGDLDEAIAVLDPLIQS